MVDGYGMIWINVQIDPAHLPTCDWTKYNAADNCQYVRDAITAVKTQGWVPGIYTTNTDWVKIFGDQKACSDIKDTPIWYSSIDNKKNYDNWSQVGGWTGPAVKQLSQNHDECGMKVNQDWIKT